MVKYCMLTSLYIESQNSCLYVYNLLLYGVFPELKIHENSKYYGTK